MRNYIRTTLWILGWLLAIPVLAQVPDPTFRPGEVYKTGSVRALATYPDGSVVVLGRFDYADGQVMTNLVRLNPQGQVDVRFQPQMTRQNINLLSNVRPLPNGKLLLVGINQITAGTHSSKTLLVLNPDGSPDTTFRFDQYVYGAYGRPGGPCTAVLPNGQILLANANFSSGGVARYGVVRLQPDGSFDTSFAPTGLQIGDVRALALQPDGKILVGGEFTYSQGQGPEGRRLLRLNADGSRDASFSNSAYFTVNELKVQPDGKILVAGSTTAGPLSRLLPSGQPDPTFASSHVLGGETIQNERDATNVLVLPNGRIVAALVSYTQNQPRLMCYQPDGTPDASWLNTLQPNGLISTLARLPNGTLLAGGDFTLLQNQAGCVAAFTEQGRLVPAAWPARFTHQGTVTGLAQQPDGRLLVVGDFTELNGVPFNKVARLLANGEADTTFHSPARIAGSLITVLPQPDGRILIGGDLQEVNGQQRLGAARLLANGTFDPTFQITGLYYNGPATQQRVRCIALQPDGKMLVGGSLFYTAAYPQYQFNLLRLLPNGTPDPAFSASLGTGGSGEVHVLKLQPSGSILVGGIWFGSQAEVLKRLRADGSADPTFTPLRPDPTPSGVIRGIAELPDGRILAVGRLLVAFQRATYHAVRLQPDGQLDAGFTSVLHEDSYVQGVVRQPNGRYLLHGQLGATSAPYYLARLTETGTNDFTFNIGGGPNGAVSSMLLQQDGALVIGGSFQQISGRTSVGLARLTMPQVLQSSKPATADAATRAYPNPAHGTLYLELNKSRQPQRIQMVSLTGQVMLQQAVTQPALELAVGHLPPGMYLLRVQYATGPVTRRIVVE